MIACAILVYLNALELVSKSQGQAYSHEKCAALFFGGFVLNAVTTE